MHSAIYSLYVHIFTHISPKFSKQDWPTKHFQIVDIVKQPMGKRKRPFQIEDIHYMYISLPILTFCLVRTVHISTLPRSLECLPRCRDVVSLLRYMLLRCRELWNACYVTCCYAAEISCGILATLHVATLPRSPVVSLLRYMLLRCRDLWNACYVTCCYAAESSGMLATLHVATLPRSPVVSLLRYMLLRCRDLLWYPCHVTCCYAAEISCGILATLHVATLPRSPVVSSLRYMLLRCRDLLWYPCYVTMQLSKRVCCRSCLKRCGARERRKEIADSSFDMLSLSRMEITILSVRCTSTWI